MGSVIMNVNRYIKDFIDLLGIILFFAFILSGEKYDILYYTSLFFFGLYFYNQKFDYKTLAYIFLAPLVIVLVPHFFGEQGKYILIAILILFAILIIITRAKSRKS
jgi:hypothetical protein